MKKIILINISILFLGFFFLVLFLEVINLFFSGPPRYYELVYNLESGNIRTKKEKLIYYKSKIELNEKDDFFKYKFNDSKNLKFTGKIKKANCGSIESGIHELFFVADKKGFRENIHYLYTKTDYVLLGDSFVVSMCENRPYDLKSQLLNLKEKKSFLNLGINNINYVKQLSILLNTTRNTDFDTLIWFFYEGNDYNDSMNNFKSYLRIKEYDQYLSENANDINYYLDTKFKITNFYKFKVWLAEKINGLSYLIKYFKNYDSLLNNDEYNEALKIADKYLNEKKIKNRFIYYIPSWQRLTNHKSKNRVLLNNNPQMQQLNELKISVKNISEKNGFIFVDGEEIFMNQSNPLRVFHYGLNTHFNRIGYELLATDLNQKILKD